MVILGYLIPGKENKLSLQATPPFNSKKANKLHSAAAT